MGADRPAVARRPSARAKKIITAIIMPVAMSLAIAGIFAALGLMAADSAATVFSILFWMWCFSALVNTAIPLAWPGIPRDRRKPTQGNDPIWPWARQVMRLLWGVLLVALLIGGHYGLAALQGYGMLRVTARRAEIRRILGEWHKVGLISRAVHRAVFAVAERLAPLFRPLGRLLMRPVGGVPLIAIALMVLFSPLLVPLIIVLAIPFLLFSLLHDRALEKEMVKAVCAEGKLAWFAYAEPHQRERFMGEGGVLHGMGDALIVRNWRTDMDGIWQRDSGEDLDAMIANRFRLSNMREDLPVVVLFHPDGRMRQMRLNRAYRQRFRDGGDLVMALEGAIRQQIRELREPAV